MKITQSSYCGLNLRQFSFVIGYLNLLSILVNIVCHSVIVYTVTNGLQCDITKENLSDIHWAWLAPLLVVVNVGAHGFYPFPLIFHYCNKNPYEYFAATVVPPKCYPGMLHVEAVDVLYFLTNVVWLKFVMTYLAGIHQKDPAPMRFFFIVSLVKVSIQVYDLCFQSTFEYFFRVTTLKLADIGVAILFLTVINKYILYLSSNEAKKDCGQPPSYIECLINGPLTNVDEKKDVFVVIHGTKESMADPRLY